MIDRLPTGHGPQPVTPRRNAMELAIEVVTAFVGNNAINPRALPQLIRAVHETIDGLSPRVSQPPKPGLGETLTCRECGARLKVLRRHLLIKHGLLPEAYRARHGLADDYPMTAPAHSAERSRRSTRAQPSGWGVRPAARRKQH
ncbi:MucR family transcriptional regulator [Novosphingobium flavum]|uniref:MucR family transcriptional regulator n=1 Tax=Novosphingobium flavum TaxID=1778672 RepID=A0A7X1FQ58_9SPHN|nr:MucR family transcriptional regulator [Novosphingobium flavum]MBC2664372.1 MucR family transcriptional regulator [Novosphingobium flavum]